MSDKQHERRERMIGWEVDKNGVVKVTFDQKADHFIMDASDLRRFAEGLLDAADRADEITGQEDAPHEPGEPCLHCALVVLGEFADALNEHLDDDDNLRAFDPMIEWGAVLEAFMPFYDEMVEGEEHDGETKH
jgi:hypothetical protein